MNTIKKNAYPKNVRQPCVRAVGLSLFFCFSLAQKGHAAPLTFYENIISKNEYKIKLMLYFKNKLCLNLPGNFWLSLTLEHELRMFIFLGCF
jgi:hypothetical protein